MKTIKILKNIEPILHVTKNIIKNSDNFNNYYIHENNKLFHNQLPLLMRHSRIREVMTLKKLRRQDISNTKEESELKEETEEQKINNSIEPLSIIRKPHIRSKKLPPLCPFYSQRGKLLPEFVSSSKINSRNNILTDGNYDINISLSSNSLGKYSKRGPMNSLSPSNLKKINHDKFYKLLEINFDEFQKEILYEPKYNFLKYNNSEIFGHKEFYQEFIKELVEEILILTGEDYENKNENKENDIKKEKVFEWGKTKKKIILNLNSLKVTIKEIKGNDLNQNKDEKNLKNNNKIFFEYNLPFYLLPLFYYKGYEKFKLFLLSFIYYNEETQSFEIMENIPKIINVLLTNCKDLKLKKENDNESENPDNIVQPMEYKKNMNMSIRNLNNTSKLENKNSKYHNILKPMAKSMNFGMGLFKSQLFAGTNIDIVVKKKVKKAKFDLYPKEKKNLDYIGYNNFNFIWNISDKMFSVNIEMPLITFSIPIFNICVKQYIDFELLFYLFKINFDTWDFYVVKYLSSFKLFRILLSQIAAISPKRNMNFFLENYKIRNFESTDYKIINIITSKFLYEIEKEMKPEGRNSKFGGLKKNTYRKIIEKMSKKDINESKNEEIKEEKKEEEKKASNENNIKKKEEKIEEEEKENKESGNPVTPLNTEETMLPILTTNSINELPKKNSTSNIPTMIDDKKLNNCILEQKCFIALVTLVDTEKSISNQYTIHFNYSHFTKFKSMEKYMKKSSFLLKFININYEKSSISFDYEALNNFDEMKWINELEKYNLNYESELKKENNIINNNEEQKVGTPTNTNKNKVEYAGAVKGTTIIIEIKSPIFLLRSIDKDGKIYTKSTEAFEEEENKLNLNEENNFVNLSKNIFDLSIYHKQKEIDDKNKKDLADNILFFAFKKKSVK